MILATPSSLQVYLDTVSAIAFTGAKVYEVYDIY